MRRTVIAELLDDDLGTPEEVAASLADLRGINARFGGVQTTARLLQRVATQSGLRELSVLEVAAGAGDLCLDVQQFLAREGVQLRVVLLDRMWSHVDGRPLPAVCGDALRLPFRNDSFDVVSCSLFAHHLERDEVRGFAAGAIRVCRRALLINDLIRSPIHLALVYASLPLLRSRLTRHDAPASVRRAYTLQEMRDALRALPGVRLEMSKHYLYRMGVLVWKSST